MTTTPAQPHMLIIPKEVVDQFIEIIGEENLISQGEFFEQYGRDQTENLLFLPNLVLKPGNTEEISRIMKICHNEGLAVTPRGGGTGLSGGALPQFGGIVISTERLNQIIEIDERNLQVTTQPGVITEVLQNAVKEKGLFYPPDPSSRGSCFIGGNISANSGGPKAVKYGVVRDYVLNLEVVLPSGEVIWTGANVLKNSTGYNLTQLIVGSEGTLCIVTQIVLKLIPLPKYDLLMLVPFKSLEKAGQAVSAIFRAGFVPSALELIELEALQIASDFVNNTTIPIENDIAAHLIIEVDGNNLEILMGEMEAINELLYQFDAGDALFADDEQQKAELWKMRRRAAEGIKLQGYVKELDTVVPRAELPALIHGVKTLGKNYGFHAVCFGHAGDGNLHIWVKKVATASGNGKDLMIGIRAIFELVKQLGGTLSGEHGIGLIQKEFLDIVFEEAHIRLMREIKKAFDPKNILNKGKIFDLS